MPAINRIIQILPTLARGDAVSNDVLAFDTILRELGYETDIYCMYTSDSLKSRCRLIDCNNTVFNKDDLIIYHFAIASPLSTLFANSDCHKIIVYHNVTPPDFFSAYLDFRTANYCATGIKEIQHIVPYAELCIADSEENKKSLIQYGASCPIEVLPIVIPFEDYKIKPDQQTLSEMADGKTNILFVGRVAPNKCHQDIISAFYCYKELYNQDSRLLLVGKYEDNSVFYQKLREYVNILNISDVSFIQHVSFERLIAYFSSAHVFLLESEHEGFCVPLVEAMYFGIPIIAYSSTAVPETLGGSGILIKDKNPMLTAGLINRIMTDSDLRQRIINEEKERLRYFDYENTKKRFIEILNSYLSQSC